MWGERERDGKKFMGVFRTTILVDAQGRVENVWENVKFQGHAQQILDAFHKKKAKLEAQATE